MKEKESRLLRFYLILILITSFMQISSVFFSNIGDFISHRSLLLLVFIWGAFNLFCLSSFIRQKLPGITLILPIFNVVILVLLFVLASLLAIFSIIGTGNIVNGTLLSTFEIVISIFNMGLAAYQLYIFQE